VGRPASAAQERPNIDDARAEASENSIGNAPKSTDLISRTLRCKPNSLDASLNQDRKEIAVDDAKESARVGLPGITTYVALLVELRTNQHVATGSGSADRESGSAASTT
jgi:hypothetical protein